ncbi:DUF1737 domain-containing protein [Pseudomonas sp. 21LCFQ010]|uniref:DUF1737 domain-containing protein n=1 Tax=Pseudomonas sp. 21LCFQ010 TaxID=2957506 RepID=UPI002098640A|nr:DUF1737 domain-containing protein [Pseudomonas sp. 21LCFQ010]MCO8160961.1 DUF1737 domain-containing protein [Pseudomonas sp. 21LCFQ010]
MSYTHYETVFADHADELQDKMTAKISDGWQPYGNPICITLQQTHKTFQLVQAIVKGTPDGGGGSGPISSADITDASATGKSVLTSADQPAARAAIGAGTSNFSGSYVDLSNKPTIPAAPGNGDAGKLQAGTDTTQTLWTAKIIHDEIKRQISAIP